MITHDVNIIFILTDKIYIEPEYGFICTFKKIKYKFKNLYLFNYGNK